MELVKVVFVAAVGLWVAAAAQAAECVQREAQFFGVVSGTRTDAFDQNMADCYLKIEFTEFKPHILCPLNPNETYDQEIWALDRACEGFFAVGDGISGYLIKDEAGRLLLD